VDRLVYEANNTDLGERLVLIDCRHSFEFEGGHIRNAYNIQNPKEVEFKLFGQMVQQ
jgi:rhodanese-related sulfurtransferase